MDLSRVEAYPIAIKGNLGEKDSNPEYWEYICESIPGPGCEKENFQNGYEGCNCSGICLEPVCICLKRFGSAYSNEGKLVETHLTENKPIIECGMLCKCAMSCQNRVVQNGIAQGYCIFKTQNCGWGLMSFKDISKFSFICEYAGEIISKQEAKSHSEHRVGCNYIYVVNEHTSGGTIETIIDPTKKGNIGRFINHSCSPNLIGLPIRCSNLVPKLCFFALQDIPAFTELTYDYSGDSEAQLGDQICYCRTSKCRGFLPFDPLTF